MIRQRATEQQLDYLRHMEPRRPSRRLEIDPKLQKKEENTRHIFSNPEIMRQPSEEKWLLSPEAALTPTYLGQLGKIDLEAFGCIEVVHGDAFTQETEAVMLPMPPNLMPYRGISLEACDRGGKELMKEIFHAAKNSCAQRDRLTKGLQTGDTLVVKSSGFSMQNILFVIMPWFWQGSPMDAAKRLRYCARSAFQQAGSPTGFSSIALPNIGGGIFGYDPKNSCRLLVEEAIEALLQIEAERPCYNLKHITFIENRQETAELFNEALTEVAHRWLPERRVTTAPQHWGHMTRRLVVLPAVPNFFWRRHKVKFKKYHGVKRKEKHNYVGNMRPYLWRAMKVAQPPPLMVLQQTGDVAPTNFQLKARPYFFRGVTHWLFPSRRSGFYALRKSSKGHWMAHIQRYRVVEDVRPRL